MIIGDAIAVGKRPTEHCQTFKVQAVSLKREKIRKKGKKKTKEEEKKTENRYSDNKVRRQNVLTTKCPTPLCTSLAI